MVVHSLDVDAAIRAQNERLTRGKEGEEDGNDYLHSAAAQRQSLATHEFAHCMASMRHVRVKPQPRDCRMSKRTGVCMS